MNGEQPMWGRAGERFAKNHDLLRNPKRPSSSLEDSDASPDLIIPPAPPSKRSRRDP
ncbi:hypothetical protein M422DRAFT_30238 [Sphaerobolus stellatus SS14]|uniref:Uncharacterized protein n=1 Tax=Sphaerobolus stellatus (strain SS14) TaxID=990650 RepID=A0A0C9VCT4_SPHS4|nr:hypothetical protein M422DRAFT_30238 [Sphaerobolus stellatus SS14]